MARPVEYTLEDAVIDSHSREFHLKIGEMMLKRHRIYIDTNYWINLSDPTHLGKSPIRIQIYEILHRLVNTEVAICPLSYHVFNELMKQPFEKRLSTARIMDELSKGVCFIDPSKIVGQELMNFIRQVQFNARGYVSFNPAKYVWTKVGFIMGELYPTIPGLSENNQRAMRVSFFDYLSKFGLVAILGKIGDGSLPLKSTNIIERLNAAKDSNQDWKTFHEVYLREVAGTLDVLKEDIKKICLYFQTTAGESPLNIDEKKLAGQIYQDFDTGKIGKELPFVRVHSGLHAYFRFNKDQRFKENDLIDLSHAAWAIPYCHTFITERKLNAWVCNNLLRFDQVYGTMVLYKEKEVLEYLLQIEKQGVQTQ